ncbi:MAG: tetratricopeptide repeat protein, partial [Cyanobacteria bacterium KgW148]|nr:tetratricopeptide repeat protein [Cyanobacteria bacterium KgW148]
ELFCKVAINYIIINLKLSKINPEYFMASYMLGLLHWELGNEQQAIIYWSQSIRTNPTFAEGYNARGRAFLNLGDYGRAINDFTLAIRIKPDYAEAYHNRGNAKAALGDYQGADEDYNHAIELKIAENDIEFYSKDIEEIDWYEDCITEMGYDDYDTETMEIEEIDEYDCYYYYDGGIEEVGDCEMNNDFGKMPNIKVSKSPLPLSENFRVSKEIELK